ncbi:MAG: phosphatase PAP2 family protein [Bacteroidia bacterium]|nr:MAG: phosphatase PAP2 family protein [Bacteroidia bacterium]
MADFLYSIDLGLFYFINHTLQNALFDAVMPVITDLNKIPAVLVAVAGLLILLAVKGGGTGRSAVVLLIVTIAFSDQLNSSWVKHLFERVRPCHVLNDVHLLVSCGSGYAFPSSHAVNNAAGAVVLSFFYRRWTAVFAAFAGLVAFSRVYVGVHYPGDVVGGLVLGAACGGLTVFLFVKARTWWNERKIKGGSS